MTDKAKTIRTVLIRLGYRPGSKVKIAHSAFNRCAVYVNNRYAGIYDFTRNTFVD